MAEKEPELREAWALGPGHPQLSEDKHLSHPGGFGGAALGERGSTCRLVPFALGGE